MSGLAPVALFIYRRPEHLRRTLASLLECAGFDQSPVYVFADGARGRVDADEVAAARAVASEMLGERPEYHLSPVNRGLSASILGGVAQVLERHDRVVVLEDDMELSPGFLRHVNAALARFADEPRVMQVSGHLFDVPAFAGRDSALLLPMTTSWGWATWRRAWRHFDSQAQGWQQLARDRDLRRRFNLGGVYDYATMLERQMHGIGDSWAIRWHWSVFHADGLTVFPPVSMVRNTGMDGSGTHGRGLLRRLRAVSPALHPGPLRLPDRVEVDVRDFAAVQRAIWRHNAGVVGHVADRIRRLRFNWSLRRRADP